MIADNPAKIQQKVGSSLDLFSISETGAFPVETYALSFSLKCVNSAPFFAYNIGTGKGYAIVQGNCHSWTCPRCGIGRAKKEYGRILEGCKALALDHQLYFFTITCRGREISREQSEAGYLTWTHRLLTTLRKSAKKHSVYWAYVQVTERQKRGHPHSHFLTTYHPQDLVDGFKEKWVKNGGRLEVQLIPALRSEYLLERCKSAGLGKEYDISEVRNAEHAAIYVAKYMFKASMFLTNWPKKWRRVRYSRSFPKLPDMETDAMVLIKREDWRKLAQKAIYIEPKSEAAQIEALYWLKHDDIIMKKVKL